MHNMYICMSVYVCMYVCVCGPGRAGPSLSDAAGRSAQEDVRSAAGHVRGHRHRAQATLQHQPTEGRKEGVGEDSSGQVRSGQVCTDRLGDDFALALHVLWPRIQHGGRDTCNTTQHSAAQLSTAHGHSWNRVRVGQGMPCYAMLG